jgi:hypothetical protein
MGTGRRPMSSVKTAHRGWIERPPLLVALALLGMLLAPVECGQAPMLHAAFAQLPMATSTGEHGGASPSLGHGRTATSPIRHGAPAPPMALLAEHPPAVVLGGAPLLRVPGAGRPLAPSEPDAQPEPVSRSSEPPPPR